MVWDQRPAVRICPPRSPVRIVLFLSVLSLCLAATSAASPTVFRGSLAPIDRTLGERMTGVSWQPGCPVALRDLRVVTASHWDFTGRVRTGRVIVHRDVATEVLSVLRRLRGALPAPSCRPGGRVRRERLPFDRSGQHLGVQLPLRRRRVAGRSTRTDARSTSTRSRTPSSAAAVRDRIARASRSSGGRPCRAGMACTGNVLVRAFAAIGWGWGGDWSSVRTTSTSRRAAGER